MSRPGENYYYGGRTDLKVPRRDHNAEGLGIRGEEVKDADTEVEAWLRRIGLPTR